jgi:murein DD-endopeptidase MepM/ murein hydrolase activator NlpD
MRRLLSIVILLMVFLLPAAPAAAQETNDGPVYIVQAGDTLSSIADRFNIDLNELMQANEISDPNLLAAGQQLVIPGLEGVTGVLDTEVVNFGDSYRSLMRRSQIDPTLFEKLNHISSPTEFYVGASMILPRQEDAPAYASASPAAGESLLELAVIHSSDVWTLRELNDLQGSWEGLPGDTLYAPGGETGEAVSGLPSAFISARISGLPLKQGGTGEIIVKTEPGVTLGGVLVDQPLHFFPLGNGEQVALQGVHALLEPGVYPLSLKARLPDGSSQSYEQMLLVVSGHYPEDPLLYVDPSTIDPAATEPEQKQILGLVKEATPERFWTGEFISPAIQYAESTYFTSRYGNRRTYIGQGTELTVEGFHTGLDFGGGVGLPITAVAAGKVVFAGPLTVRGNATIIDHGWGVFSGFWHQSEFKVKAGDMVEQGQVIGLVGGTGRVTGAHLHWELWVNGIQVDPMDWLNEVYP